MEQTAATAANGLGFAHFLTHTDAIGHLVLGILLALSLASWYLIVTRALAFTRAKRRAAEFLETFWNAKSLTEVEALLKTQTPDNAFAELARQGLQARQELEAGGNDHVQAYQEAPSSPPHRLLPQHTSRETRPFDYSWLQS